MMKIRVKDRALFSDIDVRIVFGVQDSHECFLKIEKFQFYNAVNLNTGSLISFDDDYTVIPYYNSELIVK